MEEQPRNVVIAIITYQRPESLRNLLNTIASLERPPESWSHIATLVVDNDERGSARAVVESFDGIEYRLESCPGISAARNCAVHEALLLGADWIAFVDDDQSVRPDWLCAFLTTAQRKEAAVLMGGLEFHVEDDVPTWFTALRIFESRRLDDAKPERFLATGNSLLRLNPLPVGLPLFAPEFGLTGGSDHHLGERLRRTGIAIETAPTAITDETLPADRATLRSALTRVTRTGNVMVRVDRAIAVEYGESELLARCRGLAMGLARCVFGSIKAFVGIVRGPKAVGAGLTTGLVGVGQVMASVDITVREYSRKNNP